MTDKKDSVYRRRRGPVIAGGVAAMIAVNALISWGICRLSTPEVVAFGMKATVDAFFESAAKKQLGEEESKALALRFNAAMEASLADWQQKHRAVVLVAPAVVQGAKDITRDIQQDIARRMREAP